MNNLEKALTAKLRALTYNFTFDLLILILSHLVFQHPQVTTSHLPTPQPNQEKITLTSRDYNVQHPLKLPYSL